MTQRAPNEPATLLVAIPDDPAARAAVTVIQRLRGQGHAAFLVGGCVRDLVLGLPPKDYDVATGAHPEQVRRAFAKVASGQVIEVGAQFGVLGVPIDVGGERFEIEVATFRAEGRYEDGRRPGEVRFTDAREDVLRRDFTINGLLLEPADDGWMVADFVGGLADLQAGLLRAIGEPLRRFGEDHLRILRMVRFAARFSLQVDKATFAAAFKTASQLRRISRERVRDELLKMLCGPAPEAAIRMLASLKIGALLWQDVLVGERLAKRSARFRHVQSAIAADLQQRGDFAVAAHIDATLALALLFGLPDAAQARDRAALLRDRLRLSRHVVRSVAATWQLAASLRDRPTGTARIRLLRDPLADLALLVLHGLEPKEPMWRAAREERAVAVRATWQPKPFVTGSQLREAGYEPSPLFRIALERAEEIQLAGGSAADAMAAAIDALGEPREIT